jgi:alkylation response protein AidB-like acyl-CoA dehydrogenase
LPRVVAGEVFGNATTEKGNKQGTNSTLITRDAGRMLLNGTKYYSTGSLYADWIKVSADTADGQSVRVSVHRNHPGVELVDDWDGFGQRLTASGTTRFTNVEVSPENIDASGGVEGVGFGAAYVQGILLVALGGIASAVRRDAIDYVRGRERAFSHGVGDSPQRDPLVQEVVGRISSTVFAIESVLETVGSRIQDAAALSAAGELDAAGTAELDTVLSEAQIFVVEQTLDVANRLFEVGGASAASETRGLDRHWRNARVLGQHNPVIYRARAVGQQRLTGDHLTTPIYVGATTPGGDAA